MDKEQMFDVVEQMYRISNVGGIDENANKDSRVIPTQRDLLAGQVSREYALKKLIPAHIAQAHIDGDIHWHDLDYSPFFPMFNCMLIDLKGMLSRGFKMGNAEIETPRSISTACNVTSQIIAQVASHIYGGNTINRIDEVLAPYVRKSYDKALAKGLIWFEGDQRKAAVFATQTVEKATYDAFQCLEYQINTLNTCNGQTPFTTLNFGLGISWESRLIQKSILQNRIDGLGKTQKTAIFPKLVFTIKKGVNFKPGDPNYDIKQLALKCATKRMYPDILNYDRVVDVTGGFKGPMGCRSFLGEYQDENGEAVYEGRNNLGVISVNLPRIAIESKGSLNRFFSLLQARLSLAREALDVRIARFDEVKASCAPILYVEGACGVRLNPNDRVSEIFKHGRASVSLGYIGLHETVTYLMGNEPHTFDSADKRELAHRIVATLRQAVDSWKAETGYGFSLYSTPSESLCDRFYRLDVAKFGETECFGKKGYYTNSFHLDVAKKVTPFEKIDFERGYPALASGGFISYVEFPSMANNLKGLEMVWDYTYDRLPYFGTNTPIDHCEACGFSGEATATPTGFECPHCGHRGKKLSVTRRVCGYLGNPDDRPFNPGKQAEVARRVKHQ